MTPFNLSNCGNVGMGWEKIYETMVVVERPITAAQATQSLKSVGNFAEQVRQHLKN